MSYLFKMRVTCGVEEEAVQLQDMSRDSLGQRRQRPAARSGGLRAAVCRVGRGSGVVWELVVVTFGL